MAGEHGRFRRRPHRERVRCMLRTAVVLIVTGLVFFLALQVWDLTGSQYAFGIAAAFGTGLLVCFLRFFWLAAGPNLRQLYTFIQ